MGQIQEDLEGPVKVGLYPVGPGEPLKVCEQGRVIHSFIHRVLLSTYCVPGAVPGARDTGASILLTVVMADVY